MAKSNELDEYVEVVFHGPTHFLEAFGQRVKRGGSAFFHRSEVFALEQNDRIRVEVRASAPAPGGKKPPEPVADRVGGGHSDHSEEEAD